MQEEKEFQNRIQKIEGLVRKIESIADPDARTSALELFQLLLDLHGTAVERMMDIVWQSGKPGSDIIDALARDDLIAGLLLLYGLHPLDIETRVAEALDKVRPYLRSHGGNVELLGVREGVVHIRLEGSCHGCASSAQTLKLVIEEAIYEAAPDVTEITVEGVVAQPLQPGLVNLMGKNGNLHTADRGGRWQEVAGLESLVQGVVRIAEVGGRNILFCRLEETLYAYGSNCPGCNQPLEAARVDATSLSCPICGERYDIARAGQGLDRPGLQLEPFPLLVERGQAKIALPAL